MKYICFLFHLYQPPIQEQWVLKRIVESCYRKILQVFKRHDNARVAININACLTEMLLANGYRDVVDRIRLLAEEGKVELTGSGQFHPIFPFLTAEEAFRQIKGNFDVNSRHFGKIYRPKVFFPPEMAYSPEIIPWIKEGKYRAILFDDVGFSLRHGHTPFDYLPSAGGIKFIMRSRMWSDKIAFRKFNIEEFFCGIDQWFKGRDGYVFLAMDGETFGEHHPSYYEFLDFFLGYLKSKKDYRLVHPSFLLDEFPSYEKEIPAGTWSTNDNDYRSGNLFPLWKDPGNPNHWLYWQLVYLTREAISKLKTNLSSMEKNLDQALFSCAPWHFSSWKFDPAFGMKVVPLLLDIISTATKGLDEKFLEKFRKLTADFKKLGK